MKLIELHNYQTVASELTFVCKEKKANSRSLDHNVLGANAALRTKRPPVRHKVTRGVRSTTPDLNLGIDKLRVQERKED